MILVYSLNIIKQWFLTSFLFLHWRIKFAKCLAAEVAQSVRVSALHEEAWVLKSQQRQTQVLKTDSGCSTAKCSATGMSVKGLRNIYFSMAMNSVHRAKLTGLHQLLWCPCMSLKFSSGADSRKPQTSKQNSAKCVYREEKRSKEENRKCYNHKIILL